jgi:hypothetical protein
VSSRAARHFHRQNEAVRRPERVWLGWPMVAGGGLLMSAGGFCAGRLTSTSTGFALLAAGAVAVLPMLYRGAARAGIAVSAAGLRECFAWGRGRLIRWQEIIDVVPEPWGVRVETAQGPLRLDRGLTGWRRLAARCEAVLGREKAMSGDEVPAAQVASWLGLPPNGVFVSNSSWHRHHLSATAFGFAMLGLTTRRAGHPVLHLGDQIHLLRVTGRELRVRTGAGWRRCRWADLRGLHQEGEFLVLDTLDGDLWLPPDMEGMDRVARAVRHAVAAVEAGHALPGWGEHVPDAAISRLPAGEAKPDRGLSAAGE